MNRGTCKECGQVSMYGHWKDGEWTCVDCVNPDAVQSGGDHYTTLDYQPWQAIQDLHGLDGLAHYLECEIIVYAIRQGRKDDSDDAGKARHCAAKLREVRELMADEA